MKNRKTILILIGVLLLITAVLAAVNLRTRETVAENTILVRCGESERSVPLSALDREPVEGTLVNGKGEEKPVSGRGLSLFALAEGEFAAVKVTSDDEYSAEVAFDEADRAYLLLQEDGTVQLCVFGDSNSKRAVRNVKRVEFLPAA